MALRHGALPWDGYAWSNALAGRQGNGRYMFYSRYNPYPGAGYSSAYAGGRQYIDGERGDGGYHGGRQLGQYRGGQYGSGGYAEAQEDTETEGSGGEELSDEGRADSEDEGDRRAPRYGGTLAAVRQALLHARRVLQGGSAAQQAGGRGAEESEEDEDEEDEEEGSSESEGSSSESEGSESGSEGGAGSDGGSIMESDSGGSGSGSGSEDGESDEEGGGGGPGRADAAVGRAGAGVQAGASGGRAAGAGAPPAVEQRAEAGARQQEPADQDVGVVQRVAAIMSQARCLEGALPALMRDQEKLHRMEARADALENLTHQQVKDLVSEMEAALAKLREVAVQKEVAERVQQDDRERRTCAICMDADKDTSLGCGHLVCGTCAPRLRSCPFCQRRVAKRTRVYL